MALQIHAEPSANEMGTVSNIDAGLTWLCSRDVRQLERQMADHLLNDAQ